MNRKMAVAFGVTRLRAATGRDNSPEGAPDAGAGHANGIRQRRFQLSLLLLLWCAFPLFASGPTGTITGTVTDPSGAAIPKARVVVRDEATNASREAQSSAVGDYTVAFLPTGHYSVAAEGKGFRRCVIRGVILDVDQTVRVDFALVVGVVSESVVVNETPPIIQTETSTIGQVVNNRLVHDLRRSLP